MKPAPSLPPCLLLSLTLLLPSLLLAEDLFTINLGPMEAQYKGIKAVADADATGGKAYKAAKGTNGVIQFGYNYSTYFGVYEGRFRMKIAEATAGNVGSIRFNCETVQMVNVPDEWSGGRTLKGSEFKEPGKYQEFTVQWIGPHQGRMGWAAYTTGEVDLFWDCIKVRKVRSLTESEILKYLPGDSQIDEPAPREGPIRVHLMRGFFSDYFLLDMALPRIAGLQVTTSSWNNGGSCAGQPANAKELYTYDVVIMAGTDIGHISLHQRIAYKQWVEAGGSLFILGGPASFGQAGMKDSVMAGLLPMELKGGFDLQPERNIFKPHPTAAGHQILKGIDLNKPVAALFRHQLSAGKDAQVIVGTDENPLLLIGNKGKGLVACFLSSPMGRENELGEGETAFWNDPRLPALFANVVSYLCTRKAPSNPLAWTPDGKASKAALKLIESIEDFGDADALDLAEDDKAKDGLDPLTSTGGGGGQKIESPKLKKEDFELLMREGGQAAVPLLLKSLPVMPDNTAIRRIEWRVRPYVNEKHFSILQNLYAMLSPMSEPIRESALSLMGKSNPKQIHSDMNRHLLGSDLKLKRAAARTAFEGKLNKLIPTLRRVHAELKPEVEARRLARYEGYWFAGIRPVDPIWAYAETTMALLAMGEKGYLKDACDLSFLMHLQHLKIRSFIFLYNLKVPREAKMAERHHEDNAYTFPDLEQLLTRYRTVLATLPPSLHEEFRVSVLAVDDYEAMLRLLYPVYDLATANPTPEWRAFIPRLEQHTLELATKSERF